LFLINILPYTSDGMILTQLIKEITFVGIYKIWLMNDQSERSQAKTRYQVVQRILRFDTMVKTELKVMKTVILMYEILM